MIKNNPGKNAGNLFNDFSSENIINIDNFIHQYFSNKISNTNLNFSKELYELLKSYCLRKGKRIRPLLVLISYTGYNKGKKNLNEIIKAAAALEIMHSFLLVQDDIIDKAKLRRKEKTLHILCKERYNKFTKNKNIGNDMALILSDVLMSNVIEIIVNLKINQNIKDKFLKQFTETFELTAWGQILDSINSMPLKLDLKSTDPAQISILKTAYYTISSPLLTGFKLTGRNDTNIEKHIKEFSMPLGLAFQIRDDILGVFGKKEKTGKPSDSDLKEGKYTLLIQNTIKDLKKNVRIEFEKLFTKEKKTSKDIANIRKIIENSNALESSRKKMEELTNISRENLAKLKIRKNEQHILDEIIDMIDNITI